MMKTLLTALAVFVFAGATLAHADEIGFHTYEAQVSAEIVDTNYVLHPMLFAKPELRGAEIRIESIAGQSQPEVPALVTKALRQVKNKVPVTVTAEDAVIGLLKAHRRIAGAGVHGPLTVQGRLFMMIVPKGDGYVVSGSLTPASLSGPKGSWKR